MNAYLGNLPIFDHKTSEWLIHKGRLTQFLKINSVDEVKKSGILLTHLTDETYRLVLNLAFPKELEALSYKDLVELLDGHFKPKKCSFVDKAKFFGASRKSGETLVEWAARLRGLATYCDFGTALETNLRDRFVLGLGAGPERDRLFEQSPSTLTLARAIELAEQAACAKEAKVMLSTSAEPISIKEEPVYRARFQEQYSRGGCGHGAGGGAASSAPRDNARCSVCGLKNHSSDKCRYKGYKCQKCGKKGHLKKVCGNSKGSCVYHVKADQECSIIPDHTSCEECQNFNIRYNILETSEVRTPRLRPQVIEIVPQVILLEEPENEERIEEIIRNSGNVVSNLQEITLKEATIPEIQLPPNDGFGEENPDQALLLLNRTMEMMMVPTNPSGQHSGLDLVLDVTDKSHDKSRRVQDRQMEMISEHDVTMFRKSHGEELIPGGEFEKELQIPEISDIPIPEIPIPPQEQLPLEQEIVEPQVIEKPTLQVPEEIELEELEDTEPQAKKRRFRRIIIDKKTKIGANVLRTRINNPKVELRCEDSSDDIIEIRVPYEVYMRRPCHAGPKIYSNLALDIARLFMRNLGVVNRSPRAEREFQEAMKHCPLLDHGRSILERIEEVEEPPVPEIAQPQLHPESIVQARKRKSALEDSPKKQRSVGIGYVSFKASQELRPSAMEISAPVVTEPEMHLPYDKAADKENVPENVQIIQEIQETTLPSKKIERSVTALLQQAGLADIPLHVEPPVTSQRKSSKQHGSDGSETPLGSLDRTKVSLGDSELTTDSKRFLSKQWGTEGTMIKIIKLMREGSRPVTIKELISNGPVMAGYKKIMAARCFTSILKLKQHGFVIIKKCPETLEIEDIELGPKFEEFKH